MTDHSPEQRTAEMWALNNDDNLVYLLAWRLVRQRAELGGFNGLLASDFTQAKEALDAMLDKGSERVARATASSKSRSEEEHDAS